MISEKRVKRNNSSIIKDIKSEKGLHPIVDKGNNSKFISKEKLTKKEEIKAGKGLKPIARRKPTGCVNLEELEF